MRNITVILLVAVFLCAFSHNAQCDDQAAQKLLKSGLLGAATGAISSEASGGKAGKGALVGAGVNIVGGMLFDAMSGEQVGKVDNVQQMDSTEAFQRGYQSGYQQGFEKGYAEGYKAAQN